MLDAGEQAWKGIIQDASPSQNTQKKKKKKIQFNSWLL